MPVPFTSLTRDWCGQRVFLIGGGPSIRGFDFARLKSKGTVVAINDAMLYARQANVVFTSDMVWLKRRYRQLRVFRAERVAVVPEDFRGLRTPGVRYLKRLSAPGLSACMGSVYTGLNSGFAALGMTLMRGASEVYLLGYDMAGPGHFHRGYDWVCPYGAADYPQWASYFNVLAEAAKVAGARVFNCNDASAIRCFPFAVIDEVLA